MKRMKIDLYHAFSDRYKKYFLAIGISSSLLIGQNAFAVREEVYVVGVDGQRNNICYRDIQATNITVNKNLKNATLVLSSNQSSQWNILIEPGAILNKVILMGEGIQFVDGLPENIPLEKHTKYDPENVLPSTSLNADEINTLPFLRTSDLSTPNRIYTSAYNLRGDRLAHCQPSAQIPRRERAYLMPRASEIGSLSVSHNYSKNSLFFQQVQQLTGLPVTSVQYFPFGPQLNESIVVSRQAHKNYALGVYEGTIAANQFNTACRKDMGEVNVLVKSTVDGNLILSAHEMVKWNLSIEPGAKVHRIILLGYHEQFVNFIGSWRPFLVIDKHTHYDMGKRKPAEQIGENEVFYRFEGHIDALSAYNSAAEAECYSSPVWTRNATPIGLIPSMDYAFANSREPSQFRPFVDKVRELTGRGVSSFQGKVKATELLVIE